MLEGWMGCFAELDVFLVFSRRLLRSAVSCRTRLFTKSLLRRYRRPDVLSDGVKASVWRLPVFSSHTVLNIFMSAAVNFPLIPLQALLPGAALPSSLPLTRGDISHQRRFKVGQTWRLCSRLLQQQKSCSSLVGGGMSLRTGSFTPPPPRRRPLPLAWTRLPVRPC